MNKGVLTVSLLVVATIMLALTSFSFYQEKASPQNDKPQTNTVDTISDTEKTTTRQIIDERTVRSESTQSGQSGGGGGGGSSQGFQEPPEEERTYCTPEDRLIEECSPNDHPVCGWFDQQQVSCDISGPCVRSTFPNECEACITPTILYWTEGECPIHL
ncbi:MAG: hypothetical protein AABX53_00535 [Nanoarchaeota archaeon]